jgi:hypothetical protein
MQIPFLYSSHRIFSGRFESQLQRFLQQRLRSRPSCSETSGRMWCAIRMQSHPCSHTRQRTPVAHTTANERTLVHASRHRHSNFTSAAHKLAILLLQCNSNLTHITDCRFKSSTSRLEELAPETPSTEMASRLWYEALTLQLNILVYFRVTGNTCPF